MTQVRYIGRTADLTQGVLLLASQVLGAPGPSYGLEASIVKTATGDLAIQLQPGKMTLPDGMIVEETSVVTIPLVEPSALSSYQSTLVATRDITPGLLLDTVSYSLVPDRCTSLTLPYKPNTIQMPLSWIDKLSGGTDPSNFRVVNLGDRNTLKFEPSFAPFSNLVAPGSTFALDGSSKIKQRILPGVNYLQIQPLANYHLYDVTIIARIPVTASQMLNLTSLHGPTALASQLSTIMNFSSADTNYVTQTFTYPKNAFLDSDVLELNLQGSLIPSGSNSLEIVEIIIGRVRIF